LAFSQPIELVWPRNCLAGNRHHGPLWCGRGL